MDLESKSVKYIKMIMDEHGLKDSDIKGSGSKGGVLKKVRIKYIKSYPRIYESYNYWDA